MVCRTCTIHPLDSNRVSSFAQWRERSWCIFLEWVSMNNFDKSHRPLGPPKMPWNYEWSLFWSALKPFFSLDENMPENEATGFYPKVMELSKMWDAFHLHIHANPALRVHLPFLELTATFTPWKLIGRRSPLPFGVFRIIYSGFCCSS